MTDVVETMQNAAGEVGEEPTVPASELNEDQRLGLTLLEEVCTAIGPDARVVTRSVQSPYLHLELLGDDIRQTWGRNGQGLDSLQFLCNLILSRRTRSDVRLMLDAEGYRARRADTLRQFALDLAREVRERGEEAEMQPLPAHERRIVHNALTEEPDITTYSEGEEPNRRIVIAPRRS